MSYEPLTDVSGLSGMKASKVKPVILIDTREKPEHRLKFRNFPSEVGTIHNRGDYSYVGGEEVFGVERKEADLFQSLFQERERFERELQNLGALKFSRLLIIGISRDDILAKKYRADASPKAVLNSLDALTARYRVDYEFVPTREEAALLIEKWAYWSSREPFRAAGKITAAWLAHEAKKTPEILPTNP